MGEVVSDAGTVTDGSFLTPPRRVPPDPPPATRPATPPRWQSCLPAACR